MATQSLADLPALINQQTTLQEELSLCLAKAEALAHVALGQEFFDYPESVMHYYLSTLSDKIEEAKKMSDQSLDFILKNCAP